MKIKLSILTLTALLVAMTVSLKSSSKNKQEPSDSTYTTEWATLSERVQLAKRQGKNRIIFPGPVGIPAIPGSFSKALEEYRVVVAQLIAQKSYPRGETDIKTWNKFKVLDELSQDYATDSYANSSAETLPEEIDQALLPIQENEFLAVQSGGVLNLDGVTVIQETSHYPLLSVNQKYLLIVEKSSSKMVKRMLSGPYGVFTITANNHLDPVGKETTPLSLDITRRYGRSLERLKAKVSNRASQQ